MHANTIDSTLFSDRCPLEFCPAPMAYLIWPLAPHIFDGMMDLFHILYVISILLVWWFFFSNTYIRRLTAIIGEVTQETEFYPALKNAHNDFMGSITLVALWCNASGSLTLPCVASYGKSEQKSFWVRKCIYPSFIQYRSWLPLCRRSRKKPFRTVRRLKWVTWSANWDARLFGNYMCSTCVYRRFLSAWMILNVCNSYQYIFVWAAGPCPVARIAVKFILYSVTSLPPLVFQCSMFNVLL